MTDLSMMGGDADPKDLANPQPLYKLLRDAGPAVDLGPSEEGGLDTGSGAGLVAAMLGSANTDERAWDDVDNVDFDRSKNRHIAFGGGVHRCLGSHLARMELRVALEEWHRVIPEYALPDGIELLYSQGLRSVDNLELVW